MFIWHSSCSYIWQQSKPSISDGHGYKVSWNVARKRQNNFDICSLIMKPGNVSYVINTSNTKKQFFCLGVTQIINYII